MAGFQIEQEKSFDKFYGQNKNRPELFHETIALGVEFQAILDVMGSVKTK